MLETYSKIYKKVLGNKIKIEKETQNIYGEIWKIEKEERMIEAVCGCYSKIFYLLPVNYGKFDNLKFEKFAFNFQFLLYFNFDFLFYSLFKQSFFFNFFANNYLTYTLHEFVSAVSLPQIPQVTLLEFLY